MVWKEATCEMDDSEPAQLGKLPCNQERSAEQFKLEPASILSCTWPYPDGWLACPRLSPPDGMACSGTHFTVLHFPNTIYMKTSAEDFLIDVYLQRESKGYQMGTNYLQVPR